MCKSFYGLPEKSIYSDYPPTFEIWCTTSLQEKEKNCNIEYIEWLNITQQYINNNPTKSDKQDESILQRLLEKNSIPVLLKPKIESDDNMITEEYC